jgi:hypothetical protein
MEEEKYRQVKAPINSSLYAVQDKDYKWGVVDEDDNVIVPFGKYAWIDGFQNGLAKVIDYSDNTSAVLVIKVVDHDLVLDKTRHAAQGIINEEGEEVLPLEYVVWKFYGKDYPTIKTFKNDIEYTQRYEDLNPNLIEDSAYDDCDYCSDYDDYDYRYADDFDWRKESWYAMTDGQYGDIPEGFDGDFDPYGY